MERGSSVVECRTRNLVTSGRFKSPFVTVSEIGHFRSLHYVPVHSAVYMLYLAIDSGGNVGGLVFARNCRMARMLPGEAENGVGMNRSVREGKV